MGLKLVLIRFAKPDSGPLTARVQEMVPTIRKCLSKYGETMTLMTPYDASVFISVITTPIAANSICAELRDLPGFQFHDETLVAEVGEDVAHLGMNAAVSWVQKHRA